MEKIALVYSTFGYRDDALKALRTLMSENLATCGNVFLPHIAVYPWKGAIKEEEEIAVLFKAPHDKKDALIARLRVLHPYELPCILELDAKSLPDYAAWLENPQ